MPIIFALLTTMLVLLTGCASTLEETETWSAEKLYKASRAALDTADYETALEHLETLEARFPFGRYAQQAQMDMIYAYYKFDEPDSAIAAAERFIKLYPRHPNVDYAYYMRGIASFNKGMSGLDYLFNLDPTQRDPQSARESFNYFTSLIKEFPDSRYANDAAQRLIYLHNNLGQHEANVAEFYLRRGAYVAAASRARYILERFQRTEASREALAILYEAYSHLGLTVLAEDALRVLRLNAPEHPLLKQLEQQALATELDPP